MAKNLLSIFFWLDLVDIATVGVLLFLAIRFVRRTRGRRALATSRNTSTCSPRTCSG